MKTLIKAIDDYLEVTGHIGGIETQRKALIHAAQVEETAAPKLLEALKGMLELVNAQEALDEHDSPGAVDFASSAIAEAEGER